MADRGAERIKFETELLRVTAVAALAIGGDSIGLLLGEPNPLRLIHIELLLVSVCNVAALSFGS